ncbi:MAG: glycyl radical protein [Spirochaetia bacterium]|jgi:formate C-acetyltransferase|nr:glycyl radical protein [Spirochaetia bacterium]
MELWKISKFSGFHLEPPLWAGAPSRIEAIRGKVFEAVQSVCPQRARYLTKAYMENQSDPMIKRRAKAFRSVLRNIDLFIEDHQLLAGNYAARPRAASIFPEYSVNWLLDEIDELPRRQGDRFAVNRDDRDELIGIAEWWKGKTLEDRCLATLPEPVLDIYATGVLAAGGNMTSGDGHIMLDFEAILREGASGIIAGASEKLEALDLTQPENHHKRIFYESVIIAYQGMIAYAERYSSMLAALAETEKDERRRAELAGLSGICGRVPRLPASTFHEAVQTVWFAHLLSQIESNGHSMSFGRLDQYLYPYYKQDLDAGEITGGKAVELLACLWLKSFGVIKIRPWSHTRFSGGSPTYQNLTLGGITPGGGDAVNELTYLCLDSIALTRLPQPNVSARYNELNPDAYLKKCMDVIAIGFGMPAMHSDRMMIPSLMDRGVSAEDANNYAIVGCIEPIVPGKFGYRAAGMTFTNFAKLLEIALNGGADPRTGILIEDPGVSLGTASSFEEIMTAFRTLMKRTIELRVQGEHCIDFALEELVPDAFCAGLISGCIARGKTPKEGGSIYDLVTGPETGIVNAANSLEAIRDIVFDKGVLSGARLAEILRSNFDGKEAGNIRLLLLNKAGKFGNDIDRVDELAALVYRIFMEEQEKYPTARRGQGPIGCLSYPCTATISGNVPSGAIVGASAEGRFAGEPLTEGCSPYHGTDKNGPTALLRSVAKMPTRLITGGNLLNMKFAPSSMASDEGKEKMMGLIKAFYKLGGWHVQFNIISTDTLLRAQTHPEEHRDLVVRVAGYSALFNELEQSTQNDIIARTEHAL